MRGIIIDTTSEKAEHIKFIIETIEKSVEMEILNAKDGNFTLIDTREYDFVMAALKPTTVTEVTTTVLPFVKNILERKEDKVILKKCHEIMFIDRKNIIGVEVFTKTCYIHTLDGMYTIPRITMKELLDQLDYPEIVRCHKSYAVNVRYVKHFKRVHRTSWSVEFLFNTDFECRVTDMFMDDVVKIYEKFHDVKFTKTVGY